jgi:hypothetical protein
MKTNWTLPTGVDERLSGWMRIQERQSGTSAKARLRPAITISRQCGCEGFPLSLRLQSLLDQATGEPWQIFDKELIERLVQEEHIPRHLLQSLEDPARYLEAFGFHPRGAVTSDEAFARLAVSILHLAREGNAIIVGRGGAILCHKLENCFHFRLEASLDWRVGSMVRRLGITPKEAAAREKAGTRQRDHFIREHLGADVADRMFYDAVFNNERHGVEEIAAAILAYVQRGWRPGR